MLIDFQRSTRRIAVCRRPQQHDACGPGAAGRGGGPCHSRRAGRRSADADQSRLRVADRRRRQSQRVGRRVVPEGGRDRVEEGHAAAPPARRAGHAAERVQPRPAEHVRGQHPRSRARHRLRSALRADRSGRRQRTRRERDQDGDRPHASRAEAGDGRQGLSRLSGRLSGPAPGAVVHRHHVRLQLLLRRRRHRAGRTAARQAGRHHPGARRHLRLSVRVLRQPDHHQRDDDVRGDVLPDGGRHAREADRDQGGGRRRSDYRRPQQLQPVQREGGRLQLLRRDHLQEHRHRDLGGHAVHRRLEGPDGEALQVRSGRHGRVHELLRVEQLLHRRQRRSSGATTAST